VQRRQCVLTLVFVWPIRIPAYVFLGLWFVDQLLEANFGLFAAKANGGGVAFFAHVGGFSFGVLVARFLTSAGHVVPHDYSAWARAAA
jgi:membrane associated rhomboid family serine protease